MNLQQLEARFLEIDKQPEPMRTDNLVHLMNTLEARYGTFQTWGRGQQAPDLETAEMRLYRAVSDARVFTDWVDAVFNTVLIITMRHTKIHKV